MRYSFIDIYYFTVYCCVSKYNQHRRTLTSRPKLPRICLYFIIWCCFVLCACAGVQCTVWRRWTMAGVDSRHSTLQYSAVQSMHYKQQWIKMYFSHPMFSDSLIFNSLLNISIYYWSNKKRLSTDFSVFSVIFRRCSVFFGIFNTDVGVGFLKNRGIRCRCR